MRLAQLAKREEKESDGVNLPLQCLRNSRLRQPCITKPEIGLQADLAAQEAAASHLPRASIVREAAGAKVAASRPR